jgi:hypothetical protein
MTTFDKREEGFENQYVHDQEVRFRAEARRNGLMGRWAAEKLGLTGSAADDYAREVVDAAVAAAGSGAALRKLAGDLAPKGISEQDIRNKMAEFLKLATEQVRAGN